jgi:hypothetical protein
MTDRLEPEPTPSRSPVMGKRTVWSRPDQSPNHVHNHVTGGPTNHAYHEGVFQEHPQREVVFHLVEYRSALSSEEESGAIMILGLDDEPLVHSGSSDWKDRDHTRSILRRLAVLKGKSVGGCTAICVLAPS